MDYWEEYSYLVAIPEDEENFVLDDSIFDKIASIKNLNLINDRQLPTIDGEDKEAGFFDFEYNGIEYSAGFYYDDFNASFYLTGQRHFLQKLN